MLQDRSINRFQQEEEVGVSFSGHDVRKINSEFDRSIRQNERGAQTMKITIELLNPGWKDNIFPHFTGLSIALDNICSRAKIAKSQCPIESARNCVLKFKERSGIKGETTGYNCYYQIFRSSDFVSFQVTFVAIRRIRRNFVIHLPCSDSYKRTRVLPRGRSFLNRTPFLQSGSSMLVNKTIIRNCLVYEFLASLFIVSLSAIESVSYLSVILRLFVLLQCINI